MKASDPAGAAAGSDASAHRASAGWDGVLLFRRDGTIAASTRGWQPPVDPPIEHLSDIHARFRQPDGMPIDLSSRARHVAVPVADAGPRLALIVEPLEGQTATADDIAVVVGFLPFRDEDDPDTLQRALGSVLAHELRTPMTTVYGGAELLSSPTLSDTTRRDAAESVARAAEQLYRVIEDLVLLVRWSVDHPTLEPVLLQQILRAAARRHGNDAVPIALDVPAGLPAVAGTDPLVEHLVRNLVGHAVASTPSGGQVTVAARPEGDWIELSIADEGPVRSDEERARAFELFAPTRRRSVDPSGANLSMVVARRVVERLGGEIEADRRDRGGRVVVRLRPAVGARSGEAL